MHLVVPVGVQLIVTSTLTTGVPASGLAMPLCASEWGTTHSVPTGQMPAVMKVPNHTHYPNRNSNKGGGDPGGA